MNNGHFEQYFQTIRQQIAILQQNIDGNWEEINATIDHLFALCEQMQVNLEASSVLEEELMQQNQQLAKMSQYFYGLFQFSSIALLVTDANGVISEANTATATLLNLTRQALIGTSFVDYFAEVDRQTLRTKLNQLSQTSSVQLWQFTVCPQNDEPFRVGLQVGAVRNDAGEIESLRIGMYVIDPFQTRAPVDQTLPRSLDGLQVLVVDDEADVREFITAILEPYGVGVRAVGSADAALEALKEFSPDVLISDIRMPGGDGYSLIRQIRALETEPGQHLPAAAITAYLDEDREEAIAAGYEAHLHKLAQPIELVQVVAQLAGRATTPEV
ncbi:PAS/PAC sensor protein [Leptolyngbya sp. NIES-3755]|nr:PAS/PAC sensor protein [Leptolyngbya sp. NIES-3755]